VAKQHLIWANFAFWAIIRMSLFFCCHRKEGRMADRSWRFSIIWRNTHVI